MPFLHLTAYIFTLGFDIKRVPCFYSRQDDNVWISQIIVVFLWRRYFDPSLTSTACKSIVASLRYLERRKTSIH